MNNNEAISSLTKLLTSLEKALDNSDHSEEVKNSLQADVVKIKHHIEQLSK